MGALGHSAGGYTVLALAGARPDLSRMRKHCLAEASENPIFCGMGRSGAATPPLGATVGATEGADDSFKAGADVKEGFHVKLVKVNVGKQGAYAREVAQSFERLPCSLVAHPIDPRRFGD